MFFLSEDFVFLNWHPAIWIYIYIGMSFFFFLMVNPVNRDRCGCPGDMVDNHCILTETGSEKRKKKRFFFNENTKRRVVYFFFYYFV